MSEFWRTVRGISNAWWFGAVVCVVAVVWAAERGHLATILAVFEPAIRFVAALIPGSG